MAARTKLFPDLPEPDRLNGTPHPRKVLKIFGQETAEAAFLSALNANRLHHAWLLSGIRGIGKATLAWRIARFLLVRFSGEAKLTTEESFSGVQQVWSKDTLDVFPPETVMRRIIALSEPRLFLLRRGANDAGTALSGDIRVDDVRRMKSFFALSAADGGVRVAIIDSVDEMNQNAANALLKLLEEPPERVVFLLVSHQPYRLLSTIRSRCRELPLRPLGIEPMALALTQLKCNLEVGRAEALSQLSGGSVGQAFILEQSGGLKAYSDLIDLFKTMPNMSRAMALSLAEQGAMKDGGGIGFEMFLTLIELFLSRVSWVSATEKPLPEAVPGEAALIVRLASKGAAVLWADLIKDLSQRARQGAALNIDQQALLLDSFLKMDALAASVFKR